MFRAYPLHATDPQDAGVIGLAIEHREPLPIKMMRRMRQLPLSARQKEVCLHLASGCSYEAIAQRMGIRLNTAIDHVRKIYLKLDVRRREDLLRKLGA